MTSDFDEPQLDPTLGLDHNTNGFHGPWPAPGKLNLMLRVLRKRPDGYHDLQTVFQFIDASDRLYFKQRENKQIQRVCGPTAISMETDLTVRAALALQRETGYSHGVDICLEKCLPIGGGLGGGSSDAATTLIALNWLWDLGLSQAQLLSIGLKLGADVPIFLTGHASWGEGVGEKLLPLILPEPWYLVIIPSCQVSTSEIFADSELTRNSHPITIGDFLAGNQVNDCLAVVKRRYPAIARALMWLEAQAPNWDTNQTPQLTGTGACLFVAFNVESAARQVLLTLPAELRGLIAKGLNRSPLACLIDTLRCAG